jgi:hypothetical protein
MCGTVRDHDDDGATLREGRDAAMPWQKPLTMTPLQ